MSEKQMTAAEYAAALESRRKLQEKHDAKMGPLPKQPEFFAEHGAAVAFASGRKGELRLQEVTLAPHQLPAFWMWQAKTYPEKFADFLKAWNAKADEDWACACKGTMSTVCDSFTPVDAIALQWARCRTCGHDAGCHTQAEDANEDQACACGCGAESTVCGEFVSRKAITLQWAYCEACGHSPSCHKKAGAKP